jgi:molybdate transport system ATP-binding protein
MTLSINIRKKLANFTLEAALSCSAGTLTAVVGPSGAGKTTLMRIISGLDHPDQGAVRLHDRIWNDTEAGVFLSPQERRLGYVFQDYTLFPHLTVRNNIGFAAVNKDNIDQLLNRFGIDHLACRKPSKLSGGERQRVAICQALAREPTVLLMDEPFSALDVATRQSLRREFLELKDKLHIPILHITHDLEEASFLADNIFVLENGHASPEWLSRQTVQPKIVQPHTAFTGKTVQFA